jgi:hypothetical protein
MTKDEALKKMYQLLLTEPHAPTLCDQLENIAREALAQPAQKPLGYIASMAANDLLASIYRDVTVYGEDLEDTVAIYTTPPQRTWVYLTDEEKHEIELKAGITEDDDGYIVSQMFKLTEAKLKAKNFA